MENIFKEIKAERQKQDAKWGEQNHLPIEWIAILTEEVGEVSKEAADHHFKYPYKDEAGVLHPVLPESIIQQECMKNYREELIQVAAVAVSMIQCLDRNSHQ